MKDSGIRSDENGFLTSGDSGVGLKEPEAGKSEFRKIQRSHDRDVRQPPPREPRRRPWGRIAIAVAAIIGVSVAIPYYLYARGHESTDDAFIEGHVVAISPRVAGHVAKIYVEDNQWVNEGDVLVELDPQDFDARLAAAEAALEAALAAQKTRTIGVELTQITSSAGVEEAAGAVEGARAAVETARAAIAAAQSQVEEAQAQLPAAQAALGQVQAELQAAEARSRRDAAHLERIRQLVPQHAASEENLSDAEAAQRVAQADLAAAREKVSAKGAAVKQAEAAAAAAQSNLRQVETMVAVKQALLRQALAQLTSAKSAPKHVDLSRSQATGAQADAARAKAEAKQARLNLSYTRICAPVSGHVTRKSIEIGAYVQVGQALMAVIDPKVWVLANFKETQLTRVRPGQAVAVELDMYPGVKLPAHVDSIQRGSGSRFSLLPPENATGNYVKVVQRVPVKIVFDDLGQVVQYALGPGMSVVPTINIGAAAAAGSVAQTASP
jgi:membrane fusion protein (multidrug efflux system)